MSSIDKPSGDKSKKPTGKIWGFFSGTYGLDGVSLFNILSERENVKRLYKIIMDGLAETNKKFP